MADYTFYRNDDLLDVDNLKSNIISESLNYLPLLNGAITSEGELIKEKDLKQARLYIDEYLNDLNNFSYKNKTLWYKGTNAPNNDLAHKIANLIMNRAIISTDKTSVPEDTRIKNDDSNLFRKLHSQYLFGHANNPSNLNVKDFIYTDFDPNSKKITGNTNRVEKAKGFREWANNNYFTYVNGTEQDKNNFLSKIDNWLSLITNDNDITENEYLALSNISGVNGNEWKTLYGLNNSIILAYNEPTLTPEEKLNRSILDYLNALLTQYNPNESNDWFYNLNILDNSGDSSKTLLKSDLQNISEKTLIGTITDILINDDRDALDLFKIVFDKNHNSTTNFTDEYLINLIILELINRNSKALLPTGTEELWYFPDIATGNESLKLVYNNKTKQLKLMNVWDIPTWIDSQSNSYFTQYQQNTTGIDPRITASIRRIQSAKQGGTLIPKYRLGSVKTGLSLAFKTAGEARHYTDDDLIDAFRIQSKYDNDNQFNSYVTRENQVTDNNAPGNDLYDIEYGGKHLLEQEWYKNWVNDILLKNDIVARKWASKYILLNPLTSHANSWFTKDKDGNLIFNMDAFVKSRTKNGQHIALDELNGPGHDFYRGRAYQVVDENGNVIDTNFYNDYGDDYELIEEDPTIDSDNLTKVYKIRKKGIETPPKTSNTKTLPDGSIITLDENGKWTNNKGEIVKEDGTPLETPNFNINLSEKKQNYPNHWLMDWALYFTRSAGNEKAKNALLATAHPYDPMDVTKKTVGDLPTQMMYQNYGADLMSNIRNNLMTADAALNNATLLQGYTKNVLPALTQGNLANNNMMRTTGDNSWQIKKSMIAHRNEIGNKNRELANTINKENRQVMADFYRVQADNLGNMFGHISYDWLKKEAEVKEALEKARKTRADYWLQNALKSADDTFQQWKKADPSRSNATYADWDDYSKYQNYLNYIYNIYQMYANDILNNDLLNQINKFDWKSYLDGSVKLNLFSNNK